MLPPGTNGGPSFAGQGNGLGGSKAAASSWRDEVAVTLAVLSERGLERVLTVREIYAEMLLPSTSYAK